MSCIPTVNGLCVSPRDESFSERLNPVPDCSSGVIGSNEVGSFGLPNVCPFSGLTYGSISSFAICFCGLGLGFLVFAISCINMSGWQKKIATCEGG